MTHIDTCGYVHLFCCGTDLKTGPKLCAFAFELCVHTENEAETVVL